MKRICLLLLGALLAFSLSACAGNRNVEEDSDGVIESNRESVRDTARDTVRETARDTAGSTSGTASESDMPLESAVRGMF